MEKPFGDRPQAGTREWFKVSAKKDNAAEVFIYDEIGVGWFGGGVDPMQLIEQVKALKLGPGDELTVRINSPGGVFTDGNAIYNNFRSLKSKVITRVDGIAASAASIIAMAGDSIEMPSNAFLFIHNPWMLVAGDESVMVKAASDLRMMRDNAVGTYLRKAGDKLRREDLVNMLDAETWVAAEDAVKYGLADVIDEPVRAAALARFDLSKYGFKVPAAIASAMDLAIEDKRRRREQLRMLNT